MWTRRKAWWPTWIFISLVNVMIGAFARYPSSSFGSSGPNVPTRATSAGMSVSRIRVLTPSWATTGASKNALPVQ